MQGFKTDIETVKAVADTRPGWDYAPAWLSPTGKWCLPEDTYGDQYRTTSHGAFIANRDGRSGYVYNWNLGYARVEFPRTGQARLHVEHGVTLIRRQRRTLTPAQRAAVAEAIHVSRPTSVHLLGEFFSSHSAALEHLR